MKAALRDDMYFVPLAFAYPEDERAVRTEDQILAGDSIMIAPVYTQNARGRYVYLPEDMKLIRFRAADDYDEELLEKGDHYVKAELNELLVFLRRGHVLPLAEPASCVEQIDYASLRYISYDADPDQYDLYVDDGETRI
jgi:alpha-glucosidase